MTGEIKSANKEGYAPIIKSSLTDEYFCLTKWREIGEGKFEAIADENKHKVTMYVKDQILNWVRVCFSEMENKGLSKEETLELIGSRYNDLMDERDKLREEIKNKK